jgi:hypothetical protein
MGVCHRDYCGKKFINMTPDNLYVRDFPSFFMRHELITKTSKKNRKLQKPNKRKNK